MKTLTISIIIMFIFPFCNKDFVVLESSKQSWAGGTYQAGTGTRYSISLVAENTSKNLVIDQLWVGKEYYKINPYKKSKGVGNKKDTLFVKNDTLIVRAQRHVRPNKDGKMINTKGYTDLDVPYEFKSEALIGYLLKGKRKYKEINEIKELKFLAYP